MSNNKVYILKEDCTNELAKIGYDLIPGTIEPYKFVKLKLEDDVVQYNLKNFYNNKLWKKKFYPFFKKKHSFLNYDKDEKAILSNEFVEFLTTWFLTFDSDNNWLGLQCIDEFNHNAFYNSKILKKCCESEIKLLEEKNLIEEVDLQ